MSGKCQRRLLGERSVDQGIAAGPTGPRPARSVTVNLAESPLGWLFARGLVTRRQFDAGERLRGGLGAGAACAARHDGVGRGADGERPRRLGGRARP